MMADVVIVGAGLVGASVALKLAQNGHAVQLIDKAPALTPDASRLRVVALNQASINWLRAMQVWEQLSPEHRGVFKQLSILDNGRRLSFETRGVIMENNHLQYHLQQACDAHPLIQTDYETTCDAANFSPDTLVLGCDGGQSWVREQAHIKQTINDYQERAIVCTVKLERSHQGEAWQHFLTSGPLAFLPLADSHHASIVWTLPKQSSLLHTDAGCLSKKLTEASERYFGELTVVSPIASFPLRLALAEQYVKDQFVLLGDAAHTIHPLAGQGVNLGFADANALTDILLTTPKHHWTHPITLKRYERKRKPLNNFKAYGMSVIRATFGQAHPMLVHARGLGIDLFDCLAPLKNATLWVAQR